MVYQIRIHEQTQVTVYSRESCYQSVPNIYLTHGQEYSTLHESTSFFPHACAYWFHILTFWHRNLTFQF
jgi:hypothetical protein